MVKAKDLLELVIKPLVGAKIVEAIMDPGEEYTGFKIELPDGTRKNVWVLSDPEGNASGFLEVVDG